MTLSVVGDFWTLAVIRSAAFGLRRFGQYQAELGIATNVLTDRLQRLVAHGILNRVLYQERPPRFDYVLSDSGAELVPMVLALKTWGDRHLQAAGP